MPAICFDTGIKRCLNGGIILDGSTHVIKAVCLDENDVTPLDSMEFASALSAGFVGTPVAVTSSLTLDATTGEIRCPAFNLGVLTGDPTESVVFLRDTGDYATSPLLVKQDVTITPNGAAEFTCSLTGDKLLGISGSGFFHKTFGKLARGLETLAGASISVQLLSAAPAYTEEFRAGVGNTLGSPVALGSFSLLDVAAGLLPAAPTLFTSITGTITHAMLYIVKGSAATDLPLGCMTLTPLVLSGNNFSLTYPATGALRFAAAGQ